MHNRKNLLHQVINFLWTVGKNFLLTVTERQKWFRFFVTTNKFACGSGSLSVIMQSHDFDKLLWFNNCAFRNEINNFFYQQTNFSWTVGNLVDNLFSCKKPHLNWTRFNRTHFACINKPVTVCSSSRFKHCLRCWDEDKIT